VPERGLGEMNRMVLREKGGRVDDIVPTIREPLGSNVRRGQDWGALAAGG
jgi:hypothetical protein